MLRSRTVDGHQRYSGGSVADKASTIDPRDIEDIQEISPTPPLIFTGGIKKWEIWRRFQHHSTLSRPHFKMQQGIQTLQKVQCCNDRPISSPSLVKLGPHSTHP